MLKKRFLLSLSLISALVIGLTVAFAQPGGFQRGDRGSRGGDQGGKGGRTFDASKMFGFISGGKDYLDQNDINKMLQFSARMDPNAKENLDRFMQQQGITNGILTRDQFTAYSQQRMAQATGAAPGSAPGPTPPGPQGGPGGGQMDEQRIRGSFDRRDLNKDGVIDLSELTSDNDQALRDEFDKWDKNKNGKLEYDEYKEYFLARMQMFRDQNGGGDRRGQGGQPFGEEFQPPQKEEKHVVYRKASDLPKELPAWFTQNAEKRRIVGQVSLKEWRSENKSVEDFRKYDRNLDGFITVEEVLAVERKKNPSLGRRNDQEGAVAVAEEPTEEALIVFAGPGAISEDTPIVALAMGQGNPGGFGSAQMGGFQGRGGNRGGIPQMGGGNTRGSMPQMGGGYRGGQQNGNSGNKPSRGNRPG